MDDKKETIDIIPTALDGDAYETIDYFYKTSGERSGPIDDTTYKPTTHLEWIREFTDDQLARFICIIKHGPDRYIPERYGCVHETCQKFDHNCIECIKAWLNKKVGEDSESDEILRQVSSTETA